MLKKVERHLFWIAVGFIIALMAMGMSATDSSSLTNSFKVGKVNDVRTITGKTLTTDASKQDKAAYLPERVISIKNEDVHTKWRYLYLSIEKPEEVINCQLNYYNKDGELVYAQKDVQLQSSVNKIDLQIDFKYKYMHISFISPENILLKVKNIQIREFDKVNISIKDAVIALAVLVIYLLFYFVASSLCKKHNINFYKLIEVMQDIYIVIGNALLWVPEKVSLIRYKYFRSILIVFWMSYMMFMTNMGKYSSYYKYHIVICLILILLLIISMIEKPLRRIQWNRTIVYYWIGMSVLMCISEYIYSKRYLLTGFIFLSFFGFLYFVWNNMEDRRTFFKDIIYALEISFFFSVIFSVLFREKFEWIGYAGPAWNPNAFSMYLVPVLVAFLSEIEESLRYKKTKKYLLNLVLLEVAISFNYLADSRIGNLMMAVALLLFLIHLKRNVLEDIHLNKIIVGLVFAVLLLVPTYYITNWSVSYIPQKIGVKIEFPADDFKAASSGTVMDVKAAEKESLADAIIYAPKTTHFLNGRNLYWMGYIRNMNFLGHDFCPRLWGGTRTAHNGMLAIAYRYGVLTAVPYLFVFLCSIYLSFSRLRDRKDNYAFLTFGMCVISLGFMLVENFERPFLATEWIVFYLIIGDLFCDDQKRCEISNRES